MQPFYYVLTLAVMFGTPLVIFSMKYWSDAYQARMHARADDAYRALAENAVRTQSDTAASLTAVKSELADIGSRLSAVENILKAVE